jgi:proline iminopeptidase
MRPTNEPFPITEPFNTGYVQVSDLHRVYFEEVGNPAGVPIVFLHGGPGGGIAPKHRTFFDPRFFRVILFDQRGCGRSAPFAELRENTTWDLVADIEGLRNHLGIERWHVFGGSWGSTLALAYAITHPDRARSLTLRGIFLLRKKEVLWFYQEGASYIFPEEFELYQRPIPPAERGDMMAAYYKRLTGTDEEAQRACAAAWSRWEAATWKLRVDSADVQSMVAPATAIPFARIECHYFVNNGFFSTDNYLIEQAHRIRSIPTRILHGRYDVVCPISAAFDLHKALPQSRLEVLPVAGHSAFCPDVYAALVRYTEELKTFEAR